MKNEHVAEALRRAGFRATRQRIALHSFLAKTTRPLLIQEVVEGLRKSIDPVTVYRMMDAFKKAGVVREVNLRGDHPRYELEDEHDHHHIVCTDCGRVEDFTEHTHERVEKQVLARSKAFKKITGHAFDLYGLCNTCAR
ncbi:MAG TPA: Fur family transcriptional regulator [Candidatus Paceibacterota bacterium]|nr:Fur family transcriptional regulator [Candidatus Paceibacterota bacterium]